ncbi:MAG: hypothetical protein ACFCUE_04990 [Candidatus Bathyarchaeia archaeon]
MSAVVCFILAWYLLKPFLATKESRYIGLPLGFAFLGITYMIAAFAHAVTISPGFSITDLTWFQLFARPFAFAFLTFTYFFSNKPSNKRILWNVTLSVLIVALTSFVLLYFVAPQIAINNYRLAGMFVRVFNIICLVYLSAHTLRSHLEAKNSKTILIPFGFIFLAISQYSLLLWAFGGGDVAFYGGLTLRWTGLALFLFTAYRSFYGIQKGSTE